MGYSPWGLKESDMTDATEHVLTSLCRYSKGQDQDEVMPD